MSHLRVQIGNTTIDAERNDLYIIAELGNTHEGSLSIARQIAEGAAAAGADAFKVQIFTADELLVREHPEYALFKRLEMSADEWKALVGFLREAGLAVLADVFSQDSAAFAEELGVDGFKIHSSDMSNIPLLGQVAGYGKPVLFSSAGCTMGEIRTALSTVRAAGNDQLVVMIGFQAFPTRLEDTNIRWIPVYRDYLDVVVGCADHVDADHPMAQIVPLMAVAAGALVVEKHITHDRSKKPEDYESSLNPDEFKTLVENLRFGEVALGTRRLYGSQDALAYAYRMKKKMVAQGSIPKGTKLSAASITFRRVAGPFFTPGYSDVLGKEVGDDLGPLEPIRFNKLKLKTVALVSARMDSTRMPGKTLLPVAGRPALGRVLDQLKRARMLEDIVVCTTTRKVDDPIIELAEREGVRWFRGSKDDVMGRFLAAARESNADIVVRAVGDEPLTDPGYIDRAVRHHLAESAEYTKVVGLPYGVDREILTVTALERAHAWIEDPRYREYITWYVDEPQMFKVSTLEADEQHRRPHYRLTLDYPEDLRLLEEIYARLGGGERYFPLDEVVGLLDAHPELVALNAHHKVLTPAEVFGPGARPFRWQE